MATVIVSDETIRNLIEAYASLSAWYYQMSDALRQSGAGVQPPTEDQRKAFVQAAAQHFPELAAVARTIEAPRPYVPPPVVPAPAQVMENEGVSTPAPPPDLIASPGPVPPPATPEAAPPPATPPPPATVDPTKVTYEGS